MIPPPWRNDVLTEAHLSRSVLLRVDFACYVLETLHFDAACHGAFWMLALYQGRFGTVPDDDEELAQLARVPLSVWRKKVGPKLRAMMDPAPGDGLVQSLIVPVGKPPRQAAREEVRLAEALS